MGTVNADNAAVASNRMQEPIPPQRGEQFFVVGGTMDPEAPSYIRRPADGELLEVLRGAEYAYVLDSRQKGKSSLIAGAVNRLEEAGVRVVRIDLQAVGSNVTPDQWYATLLNQFGKQLGMGEALLGYWATHQQLGPLARWLGALEEVVLHDLDRPLAVVIDEIDFVRSLPFSTDEFFAGIRELYNRRTSSAALRRVCFCLVGSAAPNQLVRQVEITPFNIAREVALQDFTLEDLRPYAAAFAEKPSGLALLTRIHFWTCGHPYLTQALCSKVARDQDVANPRAVDRLVREMFLSTEAQQHNQNLLDTSRRILEVGAAGVDPEEARARMLFAYGQILAGKRVQADDTHWWLGALRLSGAVKVEGQLLVPRNRIYRTVFDERWIAANMPDAELRRQKVAVRRATLRSISVAGAVLVIVAGLASAAWQQSSQRQAALIETRKLKANAERQAYNAQMYLLSTRAASDDWPGVAELLRKTQRSPARGWEWGYWDSALKRYETSARVSPLQSEVVFGPDGVALLLGNAGIVRLAVPQTVSFSTGLPGFSQQALAGLRQYVAINSLDSLRRDTSKLSTSSDPPILLSGDGRQVVRQDAEGLRWLYRISGPPVRLDISRRIRPRGALPDTTEFNPDGASLAVAMDDNVRLFDTATGKVSWACDPPEGAAALRFSLDGSLLAVATEEGVVDLIRSSNGKRIKRLGRKRGLVIRSVAFSKDGRWLASGGTDGSIRIWNVATGGQLANLPGHSGRVTSLAFSPDGRQLLSYSSVGELRSWDIPPPKEPEELQIHREEVQSVKVSPDGTRLVTSSRDGTVALVDFPTRRLIRKYVYELPKGDHATDFSPNGRLLAIAKPSGPILLVDSKTGAVIRTFLGHTAEAYDVRFSSDGSRLVSASADGTARIWSVQVPQAFLKITVGSPIYSAAFSPDDRYIVTTGTSGSGVARLFDTSTGLTVKTWKYADRLRTAEFSPDGKRIASAGSAGPVRVLSLERNVPDLTLAGHTGAVYKVRFSPDGKRILSYSWDMTARLWDAATGRTIAVLRHGGWVASANFSADGSRIVTGAADNLVRVWDGFTGEELAQLQGHTAPVFDTIWTPDGRSIVSASNDATVRVWNSRPSRQAGDYLESLDTR